MVLRVDANRCPSTVVASRELHQEMLRY
eukprot:COSAG02_NODE_19877_length_860_cov_1.503285_1_plen_27_part_10